MKIKLGVIYGLPEKYATSIRLKNMTSRLKNVDVIKVQPSYWPTRTFGKISIVLKNCLKAASPKFKPDIIYGSAPLIASSIPALIARRIKKKPLIIDWDDAFIDFTKRKPKYWETCYWEYKAIKEADKVVVVSKKLEEVATKLRGSSRDVCYIPNGVDIGLFDPMKYKKERVRIREKYGIKNNEVVVGFFGYIPKLEGGDFVGSEIAKASLNLVKKHNVRNIKFLIIGFGDGISLFKDYVEKHELDHHFIFEDFIPHQEMPRYISCMDIGAIPFARTFTGLARSSCKIKEFMAMGVPAITVDFGENKRDLAGGAGFLIKDNKFIENAVLHLLENRRLRKKIGRKARKKAKEQFDFEMLRKKFYLLLNNIYTKKILKK